MRSQAVTVHSEHGLHLRIAAQVAQIAKRCGGAVHILCRNCRNCLRVNACSALEVMMLGAAEGTRLRIVAEGPFEESVVRDLAELIEMDTAAQPMRQAEPHACRA